VSAAGAIPREYCTCILASLGAADAAFKQETAGSQCLKDSFKKLTGSSNSVVVKVG